MIGLLTSCCQWLHILLAEVESRLKPYQHDTWCVCAWAHVFDVCTYLVCTHFMALCVCVCIQTHTPLKEVYSLVSQSVNLRKHSS